MLRRDFYEEKTVLFWKEGSFWEKKVLLGKETSIKRRKSYFENRLLFREKAFWKETSIERKVIFSKRDFY